MFKFAGCSAEKVGVSTINQILPPLDRALVCSTIDAERARITAMLTALPGFAGCDRAQLTARLLRSARDFGTLERLWVIADCTVRMHARYGI